MFSSEPQTTLSFCPKQSVGQDSPPEVRSWDTQNAIGTSNTCLLETEGGDLKNPKTTVGSFSAAKVLIVA